VDITRLSSNSSGRWVLLLALALFSWNIWAYDLWAPDEPFFGEGAREMIDDGEWLVPHINGQVNAHKPPLFFWLIALPSQLVGQVTSFTARLPSVLAALGTLMLTMSLARRMASAPAAGLVGLMMITSHMFWEKARSAQIDSTLCFLTTLAIYAFACFRSGEWSGRRAGLVFWGACAMAALAKGPVGFLIPLGVALSVSLWERRPSTLGRMGAWFGVPLFLAITLAWAVPATLVDNGYSVLDAIQVHFVDRAAEGMHHVRPFWYYGKVLPYALLPWSFLLPGAIWFAWRRRAHAEDRFLLGWAIFVVLMFSISTEKRDLYILPAFPALFLMIGRMAAAQLQMWKEAAEDLIDRRWVTVPLWVMSSLLLLLALATPFAARREAPPEVVPWAFVLAAALAAAALYLFDAMRRGAARLAIGRLAVVMAALLLLAVTFVYPRMNSSKSGRELAGVVQREAQTLVSPQALFGADLGNLHRPINFYPRGLYLDLVEPPDFAARARPFLERGEPVLLVILKQRLAEIPDELLRTGHTVYETRLSRRDLVVLRFEPAR
jgi:4-amino-4-deoxy-L-arabinose transferase-like glycosyltransferase